jgi:hypothetical protein
MSDIKEELCYAMHKFVKEHISEMIKPASELCDEWKNEAQMLRDIRKDYRCAVWALGELLTNYMSNDYCSELFVVDRYVDDDDYEQEICRIIDRKGRERYIRPIYPDEDVVEVELGTKVVNVWKDK